MTAYTDCKYKKDRIALLREKLGSSYAWAVRGLLVIYDLQTPNEQVARATMVHNHIGFDAYNAELLSSFAEQVIHKRRPLSPAQQTLLFAKMPRFAIQLDGIAQRKLT